ncbi:MAG: hypothetical protein Q8N03_10210 [Ignavibacteria bacterium]|jgi:hypothetical protein|nr:hypothetical protein [Ignavibacteria bacterium]
MIKSLIYKEWLKVRWTLIALGMLNLLVVVSTCVSIANAFGLIDASKLYGDIVALQNLFYYDLLYIPFLTGLLLGIVQFYPEINSSRIKLTLHLPMKESKALMTMQLFGIGSMFLIFAVDVIILLWFSSKYFPSEIINGMFISILPWLLAGFVIYIFITIIFVDTSWSRRAIIGLTGLAFVNNYYLSTMYGGTTYSYSESWFYFVIMIIIISPLILWSGNNYKRGVK